MTKHRISLQLNIIDHRPKMMLNRVLFLLTSSFALLFIIGTAKGIKSSKVNFETVLPKSNIQIKDFNQNVTTLVPHATQTESREIFIDKGRGQLHKRKKVLKFLYPILMAAMFAKLVVVPLVMKLLIATTSSAFVMSKIALIVSGLIAISWLLGATRERAKLQIVQYPGVNGSKKPFGGWSVQDKYSPPYGSYNSWGYEDAAVDNNDKNFFL